MSFDEWKANCMWLISPQQMAVDAKTFTESLAKVNTISIDATIERPKAYQNASRNYREADFVEVMRQAAGENGVDVILDMVGQAYLQRNLSLLNPEGRLVVIALMSGVTAEINLGALMAKRLTVTGSTLRARSVEQKGAVVDAVRDRVWPLVETGEVKPVIYRRFPLHQVADAHRLLEASTHIGKLLLVVS